MNPGRLLKELRALPLSLKVLPAALALSFLPGPWNWTTWYLFACLGMRYSGCRLGTWNRHDWEWFLPGWNLCCFTKALVRRTWLNPWFFGAFMAVGLAGGLFYTFGPAGVATPRLMFLSLVACLAGGGLLLMVLAVMQVIIIAGFFLSLVGDPPCPPRALLSEEDR